MPRRSAAQSATRPTTSGRGMLIVKCAVVLGIVGLFAASIVPLRAMVRFQQVKRDARRFAAVTKKVLESYQTQYGKLPLAISAVGQDYYETTTDAKLMAILLGTDRDANPLGIDFDFSKAAIFIDGGCRLDGPPGNQRLLDPWGNEFHVRMDADEDKHVGAIAGCKKVPNRIDPDPTRVRQSIAVWSKGRPKPDGRSFQDCSMWIKSWD